ncbi:MAG TPA: hypothetical protein VF389_11735 [Woeseiaceae bacterium]
MTERDEETGRFLTGNNGGGRPKGSRNKLGEDFLKALSEDFAEHGAEAISECRESKPKDYVKIIASLLPKEATLHIERKDVSEEELLDRLRALHARIAPFVGQGDGRTLPAIADQTGGEKPSSVH